MKNIKTLLVVTVLLLAMSASVSAQENHGKALNAFVKFGENSSLGAFYEFQVHPDITVSPEARIWFGDDNKIAIGGRADYYFDRIFKLAEPWDIWGGAGIGLLIKDDNDDNLDFNIHIGGEYKFNDTWGLILEIGGGSAFSGGIGVGIHL